MRREAAVKRWLRRIRGALGMGLTWAVEWVLAGLLIGVISKLLPSLPWDWFFGVFDAPLPALAIPGFVGGVFFSIVLGIAGHRRRFRELSIPLFAAWGALGGLLLTLFPFALVAMGLASLNASPWSIIAAVSGPFILLSAASASASLILARMSEGRELAEAGEDPGEIGRGRGEVKELIRGSDSSLRPR